MLNFSAKFTHLSGYPSCLAVIHPVAEYKRRAGDCDWTSVDRLLHPGSVYPPERHTGLTPLFTLAARSGPVVLNVEENLPMSRSRQFEAGERGEARRRYGNGDSKASIAAYLGVSTVTLAKYIRDWGWRARPARGAGIGPVRVAPDIGAATGQKGLLEKEAGHVDTRRLASRVKTAVRKQLASIESRIGGSEGAADAERNARVLASLVKSLAELGKLEAVRPDIEKAASGVAGKTGFGKEGSGEDHAQQLDERPPRDLAQLREELAARLEKIQLERSAS